MFISFVLRIHLSYNFEKESIGYNVSFVLLFLITYCYLYGWWLEAIEKPKTIDSKTSVNKVKLSKLTIFLDPWIHFYRFV